MSEERPFDAAFFARLEALRLQATRRFAGQIPGERRSRRYGSSLEFVDFRPYAPGDDPRYVDWNIYARLGRLVLKLFSEDRDLCLHLLLDTSASMGAGSPTKLAVGVRAAAALGYVALANHERLALGLLDERVRHSVAPRRGRRQIFPLLRLLTRVRADGRTRLGNALERYAWSAPSPGIAVVISDLLELRPSYERGVRALLARGFEVRVLHVLAEEEIHPALDGDLRLVEWEDDDEAKAVTVDRGARERYADNLRRFLEDVEGFCRRYGLPYLRLTSQDAFEALLLRGLRQRRFVT